MITTPPPRFAGLDGLRAVAVLLVVVCHLFPASFLRAGFVGVDVFFVLSGFLITSLLLREHRTTGRIGLRSFWVRRARRLLPALAALVLTCASAAWLIGGDLLLGLGRQVVGAATFSYNWLSLTAGASYFTASRPELFRNLWSLAVEEQFYVLWPLLLPLVLLVRPRGLRTAIVLVAAAGSIGGALAMHAAVGGAADPAAALTRAYYGTDTHAFGLLLGVALALVTARRAETAAGDPTRTTGLRGPLGAALGILAAAALVLVASWPDGSAGYPIVSVLASLLAVVLIALSVRPGALFGRLLDAAPLRWVGERSYAIYLWHWPLVVLLGTAASGRFTEGDIPFAVGVLALLLTILASAVSYRIIEQPVRRFGFRGALTRLRVRLASTPARRFGALTASAVALALVGGTAAAVAASPSVSSSEAAVHAGQEALARASAAAASPDGAPPDAAAAGPDASGTIAAPPTASPTPAPQDPDAEPVPPVAAHVPGSRISAVGDSVMLASAEGLLAARPGIQIDAEVSRSMWAGTGIVQKLAGSGALRDYVVVGLGTNGAVGDDDLQTLLDAVGPARRLVLVTAFAPRDWIPGVNATLASFAAAHPRVIVADWAGAAAPQPDLLAGDGIHPGPTGGELYARTVGAAIDDAENQRAQAAYEVARIRWETLRAFGRLPAQSPSPAP